MSFFKIRRLLTAKSISDCAAHETNATQDRFGHFVCSNVSTSSYLPLCSAAGDHLPVYLFFPLPPLCLSLQPPRGLHVPILLPLAFLLDLSSFPYFTQRHPDAQMDEMSYISTCVLASLIKFRFSLKEAYRLKSSLPLRSLSWCIKTYKDSLVEL